MKYQPSRFIGLNYKTHILKTRKPLPSISGEGLQRGKTSDLCFGARGLEAWCSQGQTKQEGALIMIGTPGGGGLSVKPPAFLNDGDTIAVHTGGTGTLENTIKFD